MSQAASTAPTDANRPAHAERRMRRLLAHPPPHLPDGGLASVGALLRPYGRRQPALGRRAHPWRTAHAEHPCGYDHHATLHAPGPAPAYLTSAQKVWGRRPWEVIRPLARRAPAVERCPL